MPRGKKVFFNPGDTKGKLTIIEFVRIGKLRGYKCRCECGNILDISAGALNDPKRKSCGCLQGKNDTDNNNFFIGKKFNKLSITSFAHKDNNNGLHYNYICDCGNTGIVAKRRIGLNKSCGCDNKRKTGCGEISGHYWSRVCRHAKSRHIDVNITINQAWEKFLEQSRKCIFTGRILTFGNVTKKIPQTASLDRIDSNKDYTIDNVQWVHKQINVAKHILADDEFIKMCKEVVNYYEMEKNNASKQP